MTVIIVCPSIMIEGPKQTTVKLGILWFSFFTKETGKEQWNIFPQGHNYTHTHTNILNNLI